MPTYPGDPVASLKQVAFVGKDGYADHALATTMHVGTHIDAPAHMIEGGKKIHELPLALFSGVGIVMDARDKQELSIELAARPSLTESKVQPYPIVLFCTAFSKYYRHDSGKYFSDYPVMTEALARELIRLKVKLIGLDTPSPDRPPFAVHKILLGAGIPIIENLTNLEELLSVLSFDI